MDLKERFRRYKRIFSNSPPMHTFGEAARANHAENIREWLDLTGSLPESRGVVHPPAAADLDAAYRSALSLFRMGDEISAWLGQEYIALAAREDYPGVVAAQHLAAYARFGINLYFIDAAEDTLMVMRQNFKESDHPLAGQYWSLMGMMYTL